MPFQGELLQDSLELDILFHFSLALCYAALLVPFRVVSHLELLYYILDSQALAGEQHDEVIEQVGTLVDELFVGSVCSFDNRLNGFFSNLLRHLVDAFLEETGGVAALRHLLVALVDEVLQLREEEDRVQRILLSPAGIGAFVAGRTIWMNLYQEGIVVAVYLNAYQIEKVS